MHESNRLRLESSQSIESCLGLRCTGVGVGKGSLLVSNKIRSEPAHNVRSG